MSRTSTFPLHDRALDGKLTKLLTDWRDENLSYAEIAFRLRTEHQMNVSASTVMRWCNTEGIAS